MTFSSPVATLVRARYSCRTYQPRAIAQDTQAALCAAMAPPLAGPFGSRARFALVAAIDEDRSALRGLGTYGFIDHAPGFIVGAIERGDRALEDYGYLLERIILGATDLGLGTCWLGGTFSKSRFARSIALADHELMPAVASVGYIEDGSRARDRVRRRARSDSRLPADRLFFEGTFDRPLAAAAAASDPSGQVLEAVRWAPSASNRQPWRMVLTETGWHLYLERTRGYGKGSLLFTVLRLADLQRVDLGIAMCHLELTAREVGLPGQWVVDDPCLTSAAGRAEYVATWRTVR